MLATQVVLFFLRLEALPGSGRAVSLVPEALPGSKQGDFPMLGAVSVTDTGGARVTGPDDPSRPHFGTNLNWMVDWDPEKLPADLMWSARPWATKDGNGDNTQNWATVDSKGWPIVSVGTPFGAIFEGAPWVGTYKLSFTNRNAGTGDTVKATKGPVSLSNRAHNSSTNVTTYDVVVSSFASTNSFIWLMWAGSTGGITDVHLMRPLKDGSGWHPIGTALSDYIIDRLQHFTTIRTMQTGGNQDYSTGTDTVWTGRTKPWSCQTRSSDAGRFGGVAIENLIGMANQAYKDLWINIPFRADDDYILKMAQTLRYGSDGINPYTSTQSSPVFPPLNPNLKLYVEHGNEIWNPGAGYWAGENYNDSNSEISAGDVNHYTFETSNSGAWGYSWRRVGWLAVRHSNIFRTVFGDSAMMTRVRPVLATQHTRYATTDEPLLYIDSVWGQGFNTKAAYGAVNEFGHVAHPVSYYIFGLATAPYFPSDNSLLAVTSPSTILDGISSQLESTAAEGVLVAMAWDYAQANSFGLQYLAYEGGESLIPQLMSGGATSTNISNATLASYDPTQGARMGANIGGDGLPLSDQTGTLYGRVFSRWAAIGGSLFMHYVLGAGAGGGGMFGLCPPSAQSGSDPRLESGPKWDAIKAFRKAWAY